MKLLVASNSKLLAFLLMLCCIERSIAQDDSDEMPCWSDPCLNGGLCENSESRWWCVCQDGWSGLQCELDLNVTSAITTTITTSSPEVATTVATIATSSPKTTHVTITTPSDTTPATTKTATITTTSPETATIATSGETVATSPTDTTQLFATTSGATTTVEVVFPPLKRVVKSELEAEQETFTDSDKRVSATTLGITSVGMMFIVLGCIVLFDLLTAWHHMKRLNCIGNLRNFRKITLKQMCIECWCAKNKIFRQKRKRFRMTYIIYKYRKYNQIYRGPEMTIGSMFMLAFGVVIGKLKSFFCNRRKVDNGSKSTLMNNNNDKLSDQIIDDKTGEDNTDTNEVMPHLEYESTENMSFYSGIRGIGEDSVIIEEKDESVKCPTREAEEFESVSAMTLGHMANQQSVQNQSEITVECIESLNGQNNMFNPFNHVENEEGSDGDSEAPDTVNNM
ncbi:unnamed protein product [Owenia fusiformis]|uniref:EGF-like domain-containing protein n=1 Tax=Owenia fusiformis TaxID=6347 RepID=A0A8S4Q4Z6_OWEFU|nr:unnamed protein product [Owenia fusiformis]